MSLVKSAKVGQVCAQPNSAPKSDNSTRDSASNLLGNIGEVEGHINELFMALFGEDRGSDVGPSGMDLNSVVSEAATRVACICGSLATLRNKLGA